MELEQFLDNKLAYRLYNVLIVEDNDPEAEDWII